MSLVQHQILLDALGAHQDCPSREGVEIDMGDVMGGMGPTDQGGVHL